MCVAGGGAVNRGAVDLQEQMTGMHLTGSRLPGGSNDRIPKKNYDNRPIRPMLGRFHLIPERHKRTDRQTDRHNCYINIARQA